MAISIRQLRKSKLFRLTSLLLLFEMVVNTLLPLKTFALTSGPAQPEFTSFEPATTTDLVDTYTGDFTYNVPLLSVPGPNGGYPIGLSYHSGIGMDQEASWVGLGWTLNAGALNRELRGLPDDFNGQEIKYKYHIRPSVTVGMDIPESGSEFFGLAMSNPENNTVSYGGMKMSVYYNNYRGLGTTINYNVNFGAKVRSSPVMPTLGVGFDSQKGLNMTPGLSINAQVKNFNASYSFSAAINAREGFQGFNHSLGLTYSVTTSRIVAKMTNKGPKFSVERKNFAASNSSSFSVNPNSQLPSISMAMKGTRVDFDIKAAWPGTPTRVIGGPMSTGIWDMGTFNYTPPGNWSGYVDVNELEREEFTKKSYGFLNTNVGCADKGAILDCSFKDVKYSDNVPFLGTATFNYDIFSATGQGIGGMFRAYKSDVPNLREAKITSRTHGHRVVAEFGMGTEVPSSIPTTATGKLFHAGFGYINNSTRIRSGEWRNGYQIDDPSSIDHSSNGLYQHTYFKMYGEKSSILKDVHPLYKTVSTWNEEKAVRIDLNRAKLSDKRTGFETKQSGTGDYFVEKNQSFTGSAVKTDQSDYLGVNYRTPRSSNIQYLSELEASKYGFSRDLKYEVPGASALVPKFPEDFLPNEAISEIIVTKPDGSRYVYGLPAYNLSSTERLMSVQPADDENPQADGVVKHPHNHGDQSKLDYNNHSNQYLSEKTTPKYPYTWMLTGIVSADYIDVTGNGISSDDYGYWVKFNYKKTKGDDHENLEPYNWRFPFEKCNYLENNLGDDRDDMAMLSHGKKEIYYLKSIETKTHRAVFETSDRKDGFDAKPYSTDVNGGRGNNALQKLCLINLYALDADGDEITPAVSTVHFKYNYSLCKNIPNNSGASPTGTEQDYEESNEGGKLTLTKVWITNNESTKGVLNPYLFNYGDFTDGTLNPSYSIIKYDRWGNYRDRNYHNASATTALLPELGYVNQKESYDDLRHAHASAWHLRKITLPTGGELNVEYEQDDYAYVEGRRAMAMNEIVGTSDVGETSIKVPPDEDPYIIVSLNRVLDADLTAAELYDLLIGKEKWLYYKIYTKLCPSIRCPNPNLQNNYDYVSGYAEVDNSVTGIDANTDGYYEKVKIKLKKVPLHPKGPQWIKMHPFRKAGLVHVRIQRPEITKLVDEAPNDPMAQIMNLFAGIPDVIADIPQMLAGTENWIAALGYSSEIDVSGQGKSFVRLIEPTHKKFGGGVRVKRIYVTDTWRDAPLDSDENEQLYYGVKYTYEIKEDGKDISSGVAYEPNTAGEESALREAVPYPSSFILKSNYTLFAERPLLNDYYPAPSVGYRKVTVTSLTNDTEFNTAFSRSPAFKSTAPVTEYEFYSPKDFPVKEDYTDISPYKTIKRMLPLLVYTKQRKITAKSQGYSIVLNDMAGKMRTITTKTAPTEQNPDGVMISKKEYIYKTKTPYDPGVRNELENEVNVVTKHGELKKGICGLSYDIFNANHEDYVRSKTRGADINFEGLPIATMGTVQVPVFAIVPYMDLSDDEQSLKTVITIKAIYKTAILEKEITTVGASTITTENLAFDQLTGEALLTRTYDEYEKPIYNYQYAGYWNYPQLGAAYSNSEYIHPSVTFTVTDVAKGIYTVPLASTTIFQLGDEIFFEHGGNNVKGIVIKKTTGSLTIQSPVPCVYGAGSTFATGFKIIRSGAKNMLTAKCGGVTAQGFDYSNSLPTFDNDHDGRIEANIVDADEDDRIINSFALEYSNYALCNEECSCEQSSNLSSFLQLILPGSSNDLPDNFDETMNPDWDSECHHFTGRDCSNNKNCEIYFSGYKGGFFFDESPMIGIDLRGSCTSLGSNANFNYTGQYLSPIDLDLVDKNVHGWPIASLVSVTGLYGSPSDYDYCEATCEEQNGFIMRVQFTSTATSAPIFVDVKFIPTQSCAIPVINCTPVTQEGDPAATYVNNQFKFIPKVRKSYSYKTDRVYGDLKNTAVKQEDQGFYANFYDFDWQHPATNTSHGWVVGSTIEKYSLNGVEIESKDALNNSSAALFGFGGQLNTALASNAKQNEIAFQSFEDWSYLEKCPATDATDPYAFTFDDAVTTSGSALLRYRGAKHTGLYSLFVNANYGSMKSPLITAPDGPKQTIYADGAGPDKECRCVSGFAPGEGEYLLSAWVHEIHGDLDKSYVNTFAQSSITIKCYNSSNAVLSSQVITPTGNIVDGWQKIEDKIILPNNVDHIEVILSGTINRCYDDIRIHPYKSNMKSFVYHPLNFKLLATLDENNYATIYNYDENNNLFKVKVETQDGIKTVKENWSHSVKTQP